MTFFPVSQQVSLWHNVKCFVCFFFMQGGEGEGSGSGAGQGEPGSVELAMLSKISRSNLPTSSFILETSGAETRHYQHTRGDSQHTRCRHTQGHHGLYLRPGYSWRQGGAVNQDGNTGHLPTGQELPAVLRHLGQTRPEHTGSVKSQSARFLVLEKQRG